MKRRPRPIGYALHMAMLARVVVDVIDMTVEIGLVADAMFPITALPNTAFVFALAAGRDTFTLG